MQCKATCWDFHGGTGIEIHLPIMWGHRFYPWSGKIPHAHVPQLLHPHTATTKASTPGAHTPQQEKPLQPKCHSWRAAPPSPQLETAQAQQQGLSTSKSNIIKLFKNIKPPVKCKCSQAYLTMTLITENILSFRKLLLFFFFFAVMACRIFVPLIRDQTHTSCGGSMSLNH